MKEKQTAPPSFVLWEKSRLRLDNDIDLIPELVDYVFAAGRFPDQLESMLRAGLHEILLNAVEHGNLAVSYREKAELLARGRYADFLRRRAAEVPFAATRVDITVTWTARHLRIVVQDMGRGFDYDDIPDPTSPENLLKEYGRGVMLARSAYDRVIFTPPGNRVALVKYRSPAAEHEAEL